MPILNNTANYIQSTHIIGYHIVTIFENINQQICRQQKQQQTLSINIDEMQAYQRDLKHQINKYLTKWGGLLDDVSLKTWNHMIGNERRTVAEYEHSLQYLLDCHVDQYMVNQHNYKHYLAHPISRKDENLVFYRINQLETKFINLLESERTK